MRMFTMTSGNGVGLALSLAAGAAGGALSALLFVGGPVVAQEQKSQPTKVVAAQEFRLVDAEGRIRALLTFSATGEPYLALLDARETHRVWVGLAQDSGVAIRDLDGKTRLVLSLDQDGDPSLVMRDREHKARSFHP